MQRILSALVVTSLVALGATASPAHGAETEPLQWQPCGENQCATMTVPLDWSNPEGPTTTLAVLKVPASGKAEERKGSLLVNPGGPGLSGVDFARMAHGQFNAPIRTAYDIIGFDPRGTGGSDRVSCDDAAARDAVIGADPTPSTPEEREKVVAAYTAYGKSCAKATGERLSHVSTQDVARDMDRLRQAIGDEKLNYFGASYGTMLGATYADMFPKSVGRMVLDGAMDPQLDGDDKVAGQAQGIERAFESFLADCTAKKDCPLGTDPKRARQQVIELFRSIDEKPLPTQGLGSGTELTLGWAWQAVASTLYSKASWISLEAGLASALKGDGTVLMMIANQFVGRGDDGTYDNPAFDAMNAVNCLDRSYSSKPEDYVTKQQEFEQKWPLVGRFMAWSGMLCGTWPVQPTGQAHATKATGSAPIVVVGTTNDPATPYEEAVALAGELENATLVTREGDGHTGYRRGSACVDQAVDSYLLDGTAPQTGLRCTQNQTGA